MPSTTTKTVMATIGGIMAVLLSLGLVFARMNPFHKPLLFLGIISFLLIYLLMLIPDLDHPFVYTRNTSNGPDEGSSAPWLELAKRSDARPRTEK